MDNLLDRQIAHWGHGGGRDALLRVQADPQVGPTRIMESLDLQLWTRIAATNLVGAPNSDPARREVVSNEPHRSAALRLIERLIRHPGSSTLNCRLPIADCRFGEPGKSGAIGNRQSAIGNRN